MHLEEETERDRQREGERKRERLENQEGKWGKSKWDYLKDVKSDVREAFAETKRRLENTSAIWAGKKNIQPSLLCQAFTSAFHRSSGAIIIYKRLLTSSYFMSYPWGQSNVHTCVADNPTSRNNNSWKTFVKTVLLIETDCQSFFGPQNGHHGNQSWNWNVVLLTHFTHTSHTWGFLSYDGKWKWHLHGTTANPK